jgi:hypothetical protein
VQVGPCFGVWPVLCFGVIFGFGAQRVLTFVRSPWLALGVGIPGTECRLLNESGPLPDGALVATCARADVAAPIGDRPRTVRHERLRIMW